MPKIRTVTTNDPKNTGATTLLYVASTSHSRSTMRPIFTPSAANALIRTSPADRALPFDATTADTQPAQTLIAPPRAADSAPSTPARIPPASVKAAVAISCHRRTVRIGLRKAPRLAFMLLAACKAARFYGLHK